MRSLLLLPVLVACTPAEDEPKVSTDPVQFNVEMENVSAPGAIQTTTGESVDAMFAPGILVVHDAGWRLFEPGLPLTYPEMEGLVEDGMNAPLLDAIKDLPEVHIARSYAALDEDYASVPMLPGDVALLTEWADPGMRLTVVTMHGETNDVFVGTPSQGVELFDDSGAPVYQSIGAMLQLYDAGTEVNEEPGAGDFQPARQAGPNSGPDEGGVVLAIDSSDIAGFTYPAASTLLNVDVFEVEAQ